MKGNNNIFAAFAIKPGRLTLDCPLSMPEAGSFLWNKVMMLQLNNRGYAVGQFMQPEPSKYSFAPNLEAKTFMQPEHNYYANHPGRFFYIKDHDSNHSFSLPFAPSNKKLDKFCFSPGLDHIQWQVEHDNLQIEITVNLATEQAIEMWTCTLKNLDNRSRNISIYPCFSIGYMSWMNQSADFDQELNAIVASAITPYQQVADYAKQQHFADKTYLLAEQQPTSWCCNQKAFEGIGGMASPDAINTELLRQENALYEVPIAVMQYQCELSPKQKISYRFLFGPAKDKQQIASIKPQFFQSQNGFANEQKAYQSYIAKGTGSIVIESNDQVFDQFVNLWLPR
ncbi:hypothetical protein A9Q98_11550 [Thalassotalea sp. 42_200_T64]|nr:hypothetical protein A9Q98_11550 [Thalassotalea sp. 42_200_T64]